MLAVSFFKVYNQKDYTKKDIVAFYLSELLIAMTLLNGATSRPWPGEASGEATVEAMAAAK